MSYGDALIIPQQRRFTRRDYMEMALKKYRGAYPILKIAEFEIKGLLEMLGRKKLRGGNDVREMRFLKDYVLDRLEKLKETLMIVDEYRPPITQNPEQQEVTYRRLETVITNISKIQTYMISPPKNWTDKVKDLLGKCYEIISIELYKSRAKIYAISPYPATVTDGILLILKSLPANRWMSTTEIWNAYRERWGRVDKRHVLACLKKLYREHKVIRMTEPKTRAHLWRLVIPEAYLNEQSNEQPQDNTTRDNYSG